MKCVGCGHSFTNSSPRCPRCHRSTSKRGRNSKDSRLLEFPKHAGVATQPVVAAPALPAWRLELNEKVRAIKARKASSDPSETPFLEPTPSLDLSHSTSVASALADEGFVTPVRAAVQRSEMSYQAEAPAVPARPAGGADRGGSGGALGIALGYGASAYFARNGIDLYFWKEAYAEIGYSSIVYPVKIGWSHRFSCPRRQ